MTNTPDAMILLTGASGFVGRQVMRRFVEQGHRLRVVQRADRPAFSQLADQTEVIETPDLFHADGEWWLDALTGIDTVVHLAWYAEPGNYLQSELNLECLIGTIELARACLQAGVRRLVDLGTCSGTIWHRAFCASTHRSTPDTLRSMQGSTPQVLGQSSQPQASSLPRLDSSLCHGEGEDSRRLVPFLRAKASALRNIKK